ncbi:DUF1015 family protein [Mucilaginibacter sp.]|jgi:uncharacterized protein (DUF1015 family)|uniref:DUF1015 family protein n=1 Tax=Mucilaginibacter sp. TaxID=1882438 RepID=UPI00356243A7
MATIQPFCALRPNTFYADQLVFGAQVMVMGNGTTEKKLAPLKDSLEHVARLRPETPLGQAAGYMTIDKTLREMLDNGKLWQEQTPGFYIYEIVHGNLRQTGIWALSSLDDTLRIHEQTFSDSVRRLKNYRECTGLEGSPILLTYTPDETINRIITETKSGNNKATMSNGSSVHYLWKVGDPAVIQELTEAFAGIPAIYLADGHHRLAAASRLLQEQRTRGIQMYNSIASLYMATDQLCIRAYHRVLLPGECIEKEKLLLNLLEDFTVRKSTGNLPVEPETKHHLGMLAGGQWFHLTPRYEAGALIDAEILQERLLRPIFGVTDPGTDKRICYIGGPQAMEELLSFTAEHPCAVAFTLCPLTVEQLKEVADAGEILPPKATWIDPKIPYGLLLYKH